MKRSEMRRAASGPPSDFAHAQSGLRLNTYEKSRGIRKRRRRKIDTCQTFGGPNAAAVVPAGHDPVQGRWRRSSARRVLEGACGPAAPRRVDHCGFGCVASAWERFSKADTLVYIDLPLITHYWWVTKRLIKGLFVTPQGWPENSPMWSSTMNSYRVLWLCHRRLTPRYRQLVADVAASKRVHHVKSPAEMTAFLNAIKREYVRA